VGTHRDWRLSRANQTKAKGESDMRRSGKGSGGGIGMNKNVNVGVRTGKKSRAVNPGWVGQLGTALGDHITERKESSNYRGEGFGGSNALNPVEYGNKCALYSAGSKAGPGSDRTVMKTGSQGVHGKPNLGNPTPVKKTQIEDFGPDYQRKGRFG
jgi:hypothetical protein